MDWIGLVVPWAGRGRDEALQLARKAGIIPANEQAAKIEISFKNETGNGQPSISIVHVPDVRRRSQLRYHTLKNLISS